MSKAEVPAKKNLWSELARKKALARAGDVSPEGRDGKFSRVIKNQSYTWRGGRNGSGKP